MSSSVESSRTLAGVGSILLIFPFVSIVGIILVMIGMKGLSDYYKEPSIYQNALWGLIFGIIALIAIAIAVPLFFVLGAFSVFAIGLSLLGLFLLAVVVFVFYVIAAMYFRRAFSALAQRSGEHTFETAGLLLWIGAILTIVFFIGLIIILVAWILATIAFFSIKLQPQQPYASQPSAYTPPSTPPVAQPTQATRYCSYCGAPVAQDATFCPHCGKQLLTA
jgi:uncharacterized membrane protein